MKMAAAIPGHASFLMKQTLEANGDVFLLLFFKYTNYGRIQYINYVAIGVAQ